MDPVHRVAQPDGEPQRQPVRVPEQHGTQCHAVGQRHAVGGPPAVPVSPVVDMPVYTASMTVTRAKFRCLSVKAFSAGSVQTTRWTGSSTEVVASYPREVVFGAVSDNDTPENIRFAQSTPAGSLTMTVDNPAVEIVPGLEYYLDISLVPTGDVVADAGVAQGTGGALI
jgi:hypothetical protein